MNVNVTEAIFEAYGAQHDRSKDQRRKRRCCNGDSGGNSCLRSDRFNVFF